MNDFSEERRSLALELLQMFPPTIQNSLTNSLAFRRKHQLTLDATLIFHNSDISFRRSRLFSAVRAMYQGDGTPIEAVLVDNRIAQLTLDRQKRPLSINVVVEQHSYTIPSFWFLSNDSTFRLFEFDKEVSNRNMPTSFVADWRHRLAREPLNDDEVEEFHKDLRLTPQEIAQAISNEIEKTDSNLSILVPCSLKYYERLVGERDDAETIEAFIEGQAKPHIARLLQWDFQQGLAQCLLFFSHPLFAPNIDISGQESAEVEKFFQWLGTVGDRFSQLAGIEVGLRALKDYPNLEPILLDMLKTLRDEKPSEDIGRLSLSAKLFIFVDGELSRIGIFADQPPFWRRLAALAQASLIERALVATGISLDTSTSWATYGRGERFYMQTLSDLRLEPRWLPDLMTGERLKGEFLSRIRIAAEQGKEFIPEGELQEVLLGDGANSIKSYMKLPFSYLPGPLEGASVAELTIPEDMLTELRNTKEGQVLEANIFAGVVNFALIFRIDSEVAILITNVLRTVKYRLSLGADSGVTFSLLSGLAVVAAVTRNTELADDVRILARVLRRRGDLDNEVVNQMRIALVACASRNEVESWCDALGDWLVELANEELAPDTAQSFRSHLRQLLHIVPQLWRYAAKADAALEAASK